MQCIRIENVAMITGLDLPTIFDSYDLTTCAQKNEAVDCSITFFDSCNSKKDDGNISLDDAENLDISIKSESSSSINILQVNGNESEEDIGGVKTLFAVNCEIDELIHIVSFFRSCHFLWGSVVHHSLCTEKMTEKCFLCNMRSSLLRLNSTRKKGPKTLKMIEMLSEIGQLNSNLDSDTSI